MGAPSEADHKFSYFDYEHQGTLLSHLNTLRRGSEFCDVQLQVGHHTLPAHRAVLAGASSFLHELFRDESRNFPFFYKLRDMDFESFEALVNYAYTSKLEVPKEKVREVFKTARRLKMPSVAQACSRHLVENLSLSNCLSVREFARECGDVTLTLAADQYIQDNMAAVIEGRQADKLKMLEVDVLGLDNTDIQGTAKEELCGKVVQWLSGRLEVGDNLNALTNQVNVLYLNDDNLLRDCEELDENHPLSNDLITDYKKSKKRNSTSSKPKQNQVKVHKSSMSSADKLSNGHTNGHSSDIDNGIICTKTMSDTACMCVASLDGTIVKLSINFRYQPMTPPKEGVATPPNSPSPQGSPPVVYSMEKQLSFTPLAPMQQARCSVGTGVLDGKLYVMGGYDRGECLNSVEAYNLSSNTWSQMPPMLIPRGRFDVTQLDGRLYACGGCNGSVELKSVECYDPAEQKWSRLPDVKQSVSFPGVAGLDGRIYLVGGCVGYNASSRCQVFDRNTEKWTSFAQLNQARSQAGVCCYRDQIVVVGGCGAWNCTNTVEIYHPSTDKWTYLPPLNTPRRGAGVIVFKDKLYAIGGSDGQASLSTTEIYDPEKEVWVFGPPLKSCRANVGVAVVDNMLFAVGGFSGKNFLDSIEYLGENAHEFCTYLPPDVAHVANGN